MSNDSSSEDAGKSTNTNTCTKGTSTSTSATATTTTTTTTRHKVLALYKFVKIEEDKVPRVKEEIETQLRKVKARGTILLATEGINGTICYSEKEAAILNNCDGDGDGNGDCNGNNDLVLDFLRKHEYFTGLRTRLSFATTPIFHRLKVKIKKEIVTMTGDDGEDNVNINGDINGDSHGGDVKNEKKTSSDKNDNKDRLDIDNNSDIDADAGTDNNNNPKKKIKIENLKIDPTEVVGTYVKPGKEWDDLLMDPDVVVIDTRNKYEVEIGTFENAITPNTDNFRQFPDWLKRFSTACTDVDSSSKKDDSDDNVNKRQQCVENNEIVNTTFNARSKEPVAILPKIRRKPKAVAMFCTGGIRCEKSTSYTMAAKVFDDDVPVYHLDGGILAYLDSHHDKNKSKWKGECFVFDQRVALSHGLKPSETYNSCHGCRKPISNEDKKEEDYLQGVHCKHCKDDVTGKQKQRFEDRQKQIELAQKRGAAHIHDPKEVKN